MVNVECSAGRSQDAHTTFTIQHLTFLISGGVMKGFVLTVLTALAATALHAQPLVLAGGRLIDGYGGPPIENAVIVIDGNTIRTVGTQSTVRIPDGAKVIDTNGFTMMPGLMDMHVHLMILGHGDYDHWFKTYASQW